MTTGSYKLGGGLIIGPLVEKTWSGGDYPKQVRPPSSTSPFLYDMDGHIIDQRYANRDEIARAIIRKKASRIKRGFVKRIPVPHAYSMSLRKGYNAPVSHPPIADMSFESGFGQMPVQFNWSAEDDIKLLNELRPAIQGSDFQLGVFLAESPQAVRMIGDSATRLAGALSAFKKGRFSRARDILLNGRNVANTKKKTASNNWLELQYGWLPLIQDMEAGAHFISHLSHRNPVTRVRISRTVDGIVKSSSPSNYGPSPSCWAFTRKTVIANIREVDPIRLSGLTDVSSIVWEKLPWSFVGDWVIPIGNFLSARNTVSALRAEYITTTVSKSFRKPDRNVIATWSGCSSYFMYSCSMSRTVSSTISVPLPGFKPLNRIASWQHAVNAVALLTQVCSR